MYNKLRYFIVFCIVGLGCLTYHDFCVADDSKVSSLNNITLSIDNPDFDIYENILLVGEKFNSNLTIYKNGRLFPNAHIQVRYHNPDGTYWDSDIYDGGWLSNNNGKINFEIFYTQPFETDVEFLYDGRIFHTINFKWKYDSNLGDSFEPDNTPPSYDTIANGGHQTRSIHIASDVDWLRFSLSETSWVNISVNRSGGGNAEFKAEVYGANNTTDLIASDEGGFPYISLGDETSPLPKGVEPGVYYIKITSKQIKGYETSEYFIDFLAGPTDIGVDPCTVSISADKTSGQAPFKVSFSSSVNGGVSPYSFSWNFGDGGTSQSENPSHTFYTPGNYTVSLTITDSVGTQKVQSKTFNVSEDNCMTLSKAELIALTNESEINNAAVTIRGTLIPFANIRLLTFDITFPCYKIPVDIYVAFQPPDGTLPFIKADGSATSDFDALAVNITNSIELSTTFTQYPEGSYWVYWAVVPTTGGDFLAIDWRDPSILGFYQKIVQ